MTTSKLLDKLAKMKRMAEGAKAIGSEAEAQAFAEALQRMLLDHDLQMSDLEFADQEKEEPVGKHWIDYSKYPDLKVRRNRVDWIEQLACIVADAHFCRVLVHPGSSRITLVGRADHCAVAEYMLITLQRAAEKMSLSAAHKFRVGLRKERGITGESPRELLGFRASWLNGFVSRLNVRLMARKREAKASSSTALVRVNHSEALVTKFMDSMKVKKASGLDGVRGFNEEGHRRGREAADNINLDGRAVASGNRRKELA